MRIQTDICRQGAKWSVIYVSFVTFVRLCTHQWQPADLPRPHLWTLVCISWVLQRKMTTIVMKSQCHECSNNINSQRPIHVYIHTPISVNYRPSHVQVMPCWLFGMKPLPEPVLPQKTLVKFESNYGNLRPRQRKFKTSFAKRLI